MDIIDRYLNAVAAQLPQDQRADIIAELRDMILSRFEEKEEVLGRPLTEAEQEEILREIGHPLAVAARYGSGPQHVVGPELFPWWLFGVKAGLIVIAIITLMSAVVRVLIGDVEIGRAIGQAFNSIFQSGIMLVGFATVAGFIIERQKQKPRFIREWRVKDLGVFEFGSSLNADAVSRGLSEGDWSPKGVAKTRKARRSSPELRAVSSAVGWSVVLLWWIGWLPTHTTPEVLGAVVGGVDYSLMLGDIHAILYWPVIVFGLARVVFDVMRATRPDGVRFTALGDIGFGLAEAALFGWLWLYSPLSRVVFVPTIEAFIERVTHTVHSGWWSLSTVLMLCIAFGFLHAVSKVIGGAVRLVTGVDRRLAPAV
jgi:hypothetical protein